MFTGYITVGGVEVINLERLFTYIAAGIKPVGASFTNPEDCGGLGEALGHLPYRSPVLDEAPWYDVNDPDTWDFAGVFPMVITGMDGTTRKAATGEKIGNGGVVTGVRRGTRTVSVQAVLVGRTTCAVQAGLAWLTTVLDRTCPEADLCNGMELQAFTCCPAPANLITDPADPMVSHPVGDGGDWQAVGGLWVPPTFEVVSAPDALTRYNLHPNGRPVDLDGWNDTLLNGTLTDLSITDGIVHLEAVATATGAFLGMGWGDATLIPVEELTRMGSPIDYLNVLSKPTGPLRFFVTWCSSIGTPLSSGFSDTLDVGLYTRATSVELAPIFEVPADAAYGLPAMGIFTDDTTTPLELEWSGWLLEPLGPETPLEAGAVVNLITDPNLKGGGYGWLDHTDGCTDTAHGVVVADDGLPAMHAAGTSGATLLPNGMRGYIGSLILPAPSDACFDLGPDDPVYFRAEVDVLAAPDVGYPTVDSSDPGVFLEVFPTYFDGDATHTLRWPQVNGPSVFKRTPLGVRVLELQTVMPSAGSACVDYLGDPTTGTPNCVEVTVVMASVAAGKQMAMNTRNALLAVSGVPVAYFDGDFPDAGWRGFPYRSESAYPGTDARVPGPFFDGSSVGARWIGTEGFSASITPLTYGRLAGPVLEACQGEVLATWTVTPLGDKVTVMTGAIDPENGAILDQSPLTDLTGATDVEYHQPIGAWDSWRPALWVSDPGAEVTLDLSYREPLTVEECLAPFRRTYYGTVTADGPTVVSEFQASCDARLMQVEWTWVITDPFRYGATTPLLTGMPSNADTPAFNAEETQHTYAGTVTAGGTTCLEPDPFPADCASDPCCPGFTAPPTAPVILDSCRPTPANYARTGLQVPARYVPTGGTGALTWTLHNDGNPKRGIRVRVWPDNDDPDIGVADECGWQDEFTVNYLDADATLTVDGVRGTVTVTCVDGTTADARGVMRGAYGGAFTFPEVRCDQRYYVAVDSPLTYDTTCDGVYVEGEAQGILHWDLAVTVREG